MTRGDEEEVKAIDLIVERFALFGRVGTWMVDAIPILNYLPTFLAPWKKIAEECHAFESKMHMKHLHQAMERPGWNFVKAVKDVKAAEGVSQKELAYIVAILLEAGAETTTNALETFVLAARLFPRIIGPAQAELESVIGTSRLPTVDDSPNMPYINAIVKETLRWRPVVPESVPHLNTEEDEYMGYRIPKGSIILPNVWGIHLNPDIYPDPNNFLPERWLAKGAPPEHAAFGFGRRICTGQHIAYNSLFLNVARILWACNIGPKIDADGREVPVDEWGFSDGFISRPLPFEVSITPRSEERTKLVEKAWEEADKDFVSLLEKRPM
ncbi:hypothetical protein EIK77_001375 [Talaromyces pinophilus]|nr:hypothetical protein EIK77_001375 [Talaromyces pinophilus]